MESKLSYKDLLDKDKQNIIRDRLLAVNRKRGLSISQIAREAGIAIATLRSFLIDQKTNANFAIISKILGWIEENEVKIKSK